MIEATGDSQVMLNTLTLLRRNGVACLLGVDGRARDLTLDGRVLGVDAILQNRALIGSVNAHAREWEAAVAQLDAARGRWGDALEAFVGLRGPVERFEEASSSAVSRRRCASPETLLACSCTKCSFR